MSYKKTKEEQKYILEGGQKMGEILEALAGMVAIGVSGAEIDTEAERRIRAAGGIPAFKGYKSHKSDPPFPGSICFSINEEVVHGIPTKNKIIKDGDIVSIDIGMQYPLNKNIGHKGNGFFTDTALSVLVGKGTKETRDLVLDTQKALEAGIKAMEKGKSIADIGTAIENYLTPKKYGIVRDLVGHGVGHLLHEEPMVPNVYMRQLEQWELTPGVVIAIEPMVTLGTHEVVFSDDGWSVITKDRSLSAHFEHTIVMTEDGPVVATRRPSES